MFVLSLAYMFSQLFCMTAVRMLSRRRFTRMFTELKGKDYYERLRYLNLYTLEERRNRQDLIEVFKMYKGFTKINVCELFKKDLSFNSTRGHGSRICVR